MDHYNCRMCGKLVAWNERHDCTVGGYTFYRAKMVPSEELVESRKLNQRLLEAGKSLEHQLSVTRQQLDERRAETSKTREAFLGVVNLAHRWWKWARTTDNSMEGAGTLVEETRNLPGSPPNANR